jgi:peptidoglycan/LPS O-acetylase OafA/YrhL
MRSLMREDAGLSGQRTTALKGLFAIAVLLSHAVPVSGICGRGAVNAAFEALGYLGVALFFFASGYLHPLTGWILRLPTKILQRGLQ